MSRIVLEHDPDTGCRDCPLHSATETPIGDDGDVTVHHKCALESDDAFAKVVSVEVAPDWCELRTIDVLVRRSRA